MKFDLSTLLGDLLRLAPAAILGVETLVGDSEAGATKKKMAQDALTVAVGGADQVLTGTNLQIAEVVGAATSQVIDVAVSQAKSSGAYQAATKTGNALQAKLEAAATPPTPAAAIDATAFPARVEDPETAGEPVTQ